MADDTDTKTQEQGRAATRNVAQNIANTTQEAAGRASDASRTGSEAAQRTSAAAADTMRHLGDLAGETTRQSAYRMAYLHQQLAQDAARQFEQTVGRIAHIAQDSARDLRTLMQVPSFAGGQFQHFSSSVNSMVERVVHTNVQATQELFRMAGPAAIAEFQQRFMRDYLDTLLQGSASIVRAVRQSAEQTLEPLEQRMTQHVADVMEREVKLANPEDNVQQVARMMRDSDVGFVPVGEGDRLVGMVSDRDVAVRLVAEGRDPARTKVREVMTPDVRYVFEDEELEHVAENMAAQQVRRLPVMNRQKRLVGVVSLGDFAESRWPHLAGKALHGVAREGGRHTQAAAE